MKTRSSPPPNSERLRDLIARGRVHAHREIADQVPARAVAELDAKALAQNYRAIQQLVPGQAILPMVKADGYGHGAVWAARTLLAMPDLYGFGVATLEEAAELRGALGPRARKSKIVVFSGCTPWTEEKGLFCEHHGLTPVIAADEDWQAFFGGGWAERLPYELKFNTGMNRLGLSTGLAPRIVRQLSGKPAKAQPEGVFSHMAVGESADDRLSRAQLERFAAVRGLFHAAFPSVQFHLANSATIWNAKGFGLQGLTDVVRPGLSLYGVPPWPGAPHRGILPVMTLKAAVVHVHRLKPGESVGYGARYRVPGKGAGGKPAEQDAVFAAVLAAGYADGVKRSLSGTGGGTGGHAWLNGQPTRFLGVVSMDLCTIQCTAGTKVGDWVELIGPHVDPWAQAQAAGTIPYELLTSVSGRVQREYG